MQCPRCGQQITDPSAASCPNCALPMASASSQPVLQNLGDAPPNSTPYPPPFPAPDSVRDQPNTPPYGATNPAYTVPTTGAPYPPPGYPAPYPPQGYPAPYMTEPPKPRRNPIALIVGLSVGIPLVLIIACVTGALLIARSHTSSTVISTPSGTTSLSYTQLFTDPLTSNTNSWANDTHCFFQPDGYHVKGGYLCYAPVGNISNGIVSVDVKQISGPITYFYGIVIRRTSRGNYYLFEIDSNGKWRFSKVVSSTFADVLPYVPNAAIHRGLNATNRLKVIMQGNNFTFFINGTQVGQATDSTFASGRCGVVDDISSGEVVFTNFEVDVLNS
jgi:hypothetical protein